MLEYQGGAAGRDLPERYGVARSSVIALLREHGVEIGRPRVTAEETAQAVDWCRNGTRQVDIAERLGRDKGPVWHLLSGGEDVRLRRELQAGAL